eukprot:CAMPEP_0176454000 /NCGR_PEP_ID=MMETSP0127-20121128/29624_1 /TAXON_ID=938130 /ORGANISM="Platyophrya macrostoma, Strain WH" /LENGTH=275 /DNA_ID=CAMNT_0017843069 /DNA_START=67 /DNA_END=891 /DNA_ORIENTATION=+
MVLGRCDKEHVRNEHGKRSMRGCDDDAMHQASWCFTSAAEDASHVVYAAETECRHQVEAEDPKAALRWYVSVRDSVFRGSTPMLEEESTRWCQVGALLHKTFCRDDRGASAVLSVVVAVDVEGCRTLKDTGLSDLLHGMHGLHSYVAEVPVEHPLRGRAGLRVEGWFLASTGLTECGVDTLLFRTPQAAESSEASSSTPPSACDEGRIHTLGLTNNAIFGAVGTPCERKSHPLLRWIASHAGSLRKLHLNHVGMQIEDWNILHELIRSGAVSSLE